MFGLVRREPDAPIFNHMRDFVLARERSLMMAWYLPGRKPKTPFPCYFKAMTGFEYVVAAWLVESGDFGNAEEVCGTSVRATTARCAIRSTRRSADITMCATRVLERSEGFRGSCRRETFLTLT